MKKLLLLLLIPMGCIDMREPFVVTDFNRTPNYSTYISKKHDTVIRTKEIYNVGDTIKLDR